MGHQELTDTMIKDGLWDVYNNFHMGQAGELCARDYKISREAQDAYAIESYTRAQKAQREGWFNGEIIPVKDVSVDEEPGKAKFDRFTTLKPVFDKNGTITAANASSINDGAAALVLVSEEEGKKRGLTPLAKIAGQAQFAREPEWFTLAPAGAIKKLYAKTGWTQTSVDLFEINEAFSLVNLAVEKELGIDHARVNVHGGAVALGHPIGASGARILVTLLHAMEKYGHKKGIASLCIGGGEAVALGVER